MIAPPAVVAPGGTAERGGGAVIDGTTSYGVRTSRRVSCPPGCV
jgi:hypothetical protein